jgi:acyl carrier protein
MSETRTEIDNLTYDEIVGKITDALRTKTGAAGAEWTAATPLKDVGIASFDFVEYVFDMEEYFGIEIDLNANRAGEQLETIGDIAKMVSVKLQQKNAK